MSDQKKDQKQALINIEYEAVKPIIDAGALGLSCAGFVWLAGRAGITWLADGTFTGGLVFGASCSFLCHWGSANLRRAGKGKQRNQGRQRQIKVQGEKWTFDQIAPAFITRESPSSALLGFLGLKKSNAVQRNVASTVPKPAWMKEAVFHSHCDGYPVQLSEGDVFRFLRWAYKYRALGKGLSERSWDRKGKERGAWYQELPRPQWYWAMINMLYDLQEKSGRQIIAPISTNQIQLAKEPDLIMQGLRWLEGQR